MSNDEEVKPKPLTSRLIRDEMINALQDGRLFPTQMRKAAQELGFTAAQEPSSSIRTIIDVFTEVIHSRIIGQDIMRKNNDPETTDKFSDT